MSDRLIAANPLDAWTAGKLGTGRSTFDRADLLAFQMSCLRTTVAWAQQRSPFYRRQLAAIDPAALRMPSDLAQLPFTTAADLRRNDPPLLCVSQDEISRVVTLDTSGTSGAPKRLYFTVEDQEATRDFFSVGMQLPARTGDRVLILFPGERPGSVGAMLAEALVRMGATPILAGWPRDPMAAADVLCRERPDVVAGAPVPMLAVARACAVANPTLRVRSVLISSDHAAQSVRASLVALWGCEIFEHYGMTEMGLGGGVECAHHDGCHLREGELLVEVVDPVSGTVLPVGESGEVVFTTLTRRGMPLIRYRTGDRARLLTGQCQCGSPLARLGPIEGRIGGGVLLGASGELTMAQLDECVFAFAGLVDFSATVVGAPPSALHIESVSVAALADHGTTAVAIRNAIERLPSVAAWRASSGGQVAVRVTAAVGDCVPIRKRSLALA